MGGKAGGGNSKKIGRNKKSCERYKMEGREAKNKARNIARDARRKQAHKNPA